ncbi:MAG: GTP pyrophosphokinase family protein [Lachnospiraceae bacterium]|nr:GTP pyrophosphokinase family protein [Lachnospiraceae bacterium]MDD4525488.1 GTP pyrophosphokinase family protein [Lachnospiraceae bacterium]
MEESIYGKQLPELEKVKTHLMDEIDSVRNRMQAETGIDPVEHCLARIKSEDSMREKCRRKGFPETTESALTKIYDAVGIRVVCAFINDVYAIRDHLATLSDVEIIEEKDYIRHAKPNGYRSYHMILRVNDSDSGGAVYAEIQLRTISQDTWAALEHQLRYKQNISGNTELIAEELKRCADELASTDISMQTLRDTINSGGNCKTSSVQSI